jgi:choline dehydrogenase
MSSATTFDTVIIGAGTAGCLLANRLSADPQHRVLLIEAGRKDDYHWIHIPVGYLYCIGNPRTDWMYQTEADPGLNGRRLRYPRGKTLGGCSSINGMIYMRGQARDYDQWAALTGDDAWRWDHCLPDFKAHENHWRMDANPDPDFAALCLDSDEEEEEGEHHHRHQYLHRPQPNGGQRRLAEEEAEPAVQALQEIHHLFVEVELAVLE